MFHQAIVTHLTRHLNISTFGQYLGLAGSHAVVSEICDRPGPCQLSVLMETMRSVGAGQDKHSRGGRGLVVLCLGNRISSLRKTLLTGR